MEHAKLVKEPAGTDTAAENRESRTSSASAGTREEPALNEVTREEYAGVETTGTSERNEVETSTDDEHEQGNEQQPPKKTLVIAKMAIKSCRLSVDGKRVMSIEEFKRWLRTFDADKDII
uniref:Uncharacterized protein n=1 Tax=Salix viminalis TaxID=40686 RepID=A0A6N2MKD3_SALVM